MKIGMFTDPHYSSAEVTCGNRYNSLSLGKMERALGCFREAACELAIILGDVTDTEDRRELEAENLRKVADVLDHSGMDVICLMGNHDGFVFSEDVFYRILGEKYRPQDVTRGRKNLIFIDACYFSDGRRYAPGDSDWTDTYFPFAAELERKLTGLEGDVWVFMHQNIDPNIPEDHRLSNAGEVRRILEESGKTRGVFQGHYHPGKNSQVNGIRYTALPAMCENDGAYFVVDI